MTVSKWVNRLHKWGFILVSRIRGTQPASDAVTKGIRNEINRSLMMRAEINAQTQLLIKKGVFTEKEFVEQLDLEAEILCEQYEEEFKGARATDIGITIYDPKQFAETAKNWPA